MEHRLGQVGSVVMGFLEGRLESLMEEEREEASTSSSSGVKMSDVSGDSLDNQGGDKDNMDAGAFTEGSMRRDSPMLQEGGLIVQMGREVMEAGLGGWFNGNLEDVPESWSGANSDASASQDRVRTTLLTTISGRTLPNPVRVSNNVVHPVRVPDNMVHPAILIPLMEGPIRPWQCLVWSEMSPPQYSWDLPDNHSAHLGGVLLQVGPSLIDIDGEYRGGGVVEEIEENEGGDASIE